MRAPAIFLVLLAVTGGIGGYCFYFQQQQEPEVSPQRPTRMAIKYGEGPNPIIAGENNSAQHFTARTRFRILRSSAPDLFGSATERQFSPVISPHPNRADEARRYAAKLEEDVMKMRTQLKTLESLKGERAILCVADQCVVNPTIQRLYPSYQHQVACRKAALKCGFGLNHPKIKALDQSIAAMERELEQASELVRKNLEIQIESSQKMLADAQARASGEKITTDPWLETQVKVISSPKVLIRAVKRLNLETRWKLTEEQAIASVQENMEVRLAEGSNVVSVTVQGQSKTACADIANAVRDAYEEARKEDAAERMRRLTQTVDAQADAQLKKIQAEKVEMEALQTQDGTKDTVPEDNTPADTPPANYAGPTVKQRYESSVMLLNTMRELSAHLKAEREEEKHIEIVEMARPGLP